MRHSAIDNDILRFITENGYQPGDQLPTIQEISNALDMSVAKTRESLEIARALGILEIKPGRGTRVLPYRFDPAATLSSLYAIGLDSMHFAHLRQVRNAVEIQFWNDAVNQLTGEDIAVLRGYIAAAHRQLDRPPVQMPVKEHREFHMTIFSPLENPFVHGVLIAFWEAYEAFGLHLYRDLSYHLKVWRYHEQIVDAIEANNINESRDLLIEHMNLLRARSNGSPDDAALAGFE